MWSHAFSRLLSYMGQNVSDKWPRAIHMPELMIKCGMTKYRKGPTKDRKGALRAKLQEIDTN